MQNHTPDLLGQKLRFNEYPRGSRRHPGTDWREGASYPMGSCVL